MSSIGSQSLDGANVENDAYIKMVESGHIGFQLAEEVRALREEILSLKQEKRLLLVNNENLEDGITQANSTIATLRLKMEEQQRYVDAFSSESSHQNRHIKGLEKELKEMKSQYSAQKKKSKLLSQELERSLEDEVALRGYSRRLESDISSAQESNQRLESSLKLEIEDRVKCQRFIEVALRSQLILQKKLETMNYYCDRDVDFSAVSILDVSPDYLDNLLRDLRSDVLPPASGGCEGAVPGRYDFPALEHRQRNIDHQQNTFLNGIRSHVSKLRKAQGKTRKYIRQLLDVIQTYEELPMSLSSRPHQQQQQHHCHQEQLYGRDLARSSDEGEGAGGGAGADRNRDSSFAQQQKSQQYQHQHHYEHEGHRQDQHRLHEQHEHHARHKPTQPSSPDLQPRPSRGEGHAEYRYQHEWPHKHEPQRPEGAHYDRNSHSRQSQRPSPSLLEELQKSLRRSFPV